MNLTEKSVQKLRPLDKRVQVFDDSTTGFCVRVEPDGRKTFNWLRKVNGKLRFKSLGEYPQTTVATARSDAEEYNGKAAEWKRNNFEPPDPFERKAAAKPSAIPTFAQLVEAYIERDILPNARRPERAEYQVRWRVKRHLQTWLDRLITEITIQDVLDVRKACGEKHVLANRAIAFILRIFNWSNESPDGNLNFYRVPVNPAKDVIMYDETEREVWLQPDELLRFNQALKTEPHVDLKHFLILKLATAARRETIFSMRWDAIQWERKVWIAPRKGKKSQKPGDLTYEIELLPVALDVLKQRRKMAAENAVYVFPSTGTKRPYLWDLRIPWNRFRERARIPHIHFHDIRRTAGCYRATAGEPLENIARSLGQKGISETHIYARLHASAVSKTNQAGEAMMVRMMKAAARRVGPKKAQRALSA